MNTFGSVARGMLIRPPPSRITGASLLRAVSAQAGPPVETSADLICCGPHVRCSWMRSAAAPVTCGAAMLVPSKTANGGPPVNDGSVDERICPPGAATSGFSSSSKLVSPADEKSVTIPLRPVST